MGHKTRVEADRRRVVCLACPWFFYDMTMTTDALRSIGRRHERNAEEMG